MAKFEPGDRVVRVTSTEEGMVPVGFTGTFLDYDDWVLCGKYAAMVCWDGVLPDCGHDCNGLCEHGKGWCVPEQDIEHYVANLIDESEYDVSEITSAIGSFLNDGIGCLPVMKS